MPGLASGPGYWWFVQAATLLGHSGSFVPLFTLSFTKSIQPDRQEQFSSIRAVYQQPVKFGCLDKDCLSTLYSYKSYRLLYLYFNLALIGKIIVSKLLKWAKFEVHHLDSRRCFVGLETDEEKLWEMAQGRKLIRSLSPWGCGWAARKQNYKVGVTVELAFNPGGGPRHLEAVTT